MVYEKTSDLIVKERGNGVVLFTNGAMRIDGRFSHCYVVDGQDGVNDEGEKTHGFSTQMYCPKEGGEDIMRFNVRRMKEILADAKVDQLSPRLKYFRDGDKCLAAKTDLPIPEAKGQWRISARSSTPVLLYGPRTDPATGKPEIIKPDARAKGMFYSGAWGSIIIRPWFYDGKKKVTHSARVTCELVAIQFRKNGDPFGPGRIGADKAAAGFDSDDTGGWEEGDDGLGDGSDDGL